MRELFGQFFFFHEQLFYFRFLYSSVRVQEHNTKDTESAAQTRNKHPIIKYPHTISQKHRQDIAASLSVDKRIHGKNYHRDFLSAMCFTHGKDENCIHLKAPGNFTFILGGFLNIT